MALLHELGSGKEFASELASVSCSVSLHCLLDPFYILAERLLFVALAFPGS